MVQYDPWILNLFHFFRIAKPSLSTRAQEGLSFFFIITAREYFPEDLWHIPGPISICGCERFQPMREDVIYVTSSLRRRYICNVSSHWLRPCSAIDRTKGLVILTQYVCLRMGSEKHRSYLHVGHYCCQEFQWILGMGPPWAPTSWHCRSALQKVHIDGLMQERRNSIANALELRLSCTSPST